MILSLRIALLCTCISITLAAAEEEAEHDHKQHAHDTRSKQQKFMLLQDKSAYSALPNDDGAIITYGSLVFLKHRNHALRFFGRVREECDVIKTVTISGDGDILAAGTKGGLRYVWDQHGTLLFEDTHSASENAVHSMALSCDGYKLATFYMNGLVRVLDHRHGAHHLFFSQLLLPHQFTFIDKGSRLQIAHNNETEVWDLKHKLSSTKQGYGQKKANTIQERAHHAHLLEKLLAHALVVNHHDLSLRHDVGMGKAPDEHTPAQKNSSH